MLVLTDNAQLVHAPTSDPHYPEAPSRVTVIQQSLSAQGLNPIPFHSECRTALHTVHSSTMLDYLCTTCTSIVDGTTVYPRIHHGSPPPGILLTGRPPFLTRGFCFDETPLTPGTFTAALSAANLALEGARQIMTGTDQVYCLCRPPGHHAGSNFFGGFCYFNNAALAASELSKSGPTAILDIDYHHGNGTQEIFYDRHDVLYSSVHAHPEYAYPGFSGYADETGSGAGLNCNFNYPLGPGSGDIDLLRVLGTALDQIAIFDPAVLIVSLGTDIAKGDPIADWNVTENGFRQAAEMIAGLRLPILVIQEGGYSLLRIGRDVAAFLLGLKAE